MGACRAGVASIKVPRWRRAVAMLMAALQAAYPAIVSAQTVILPDGRTQTVVGNSGSVWNVSTATITGSNAFNSFSAFSVGAANTVNLHVPSSAANLINIVRDQRSDIYGILNAIKDGRIGGNVWFANPHGFVVGAGGVVNVGSLSVSTPTQQFVDNFFSMPGSPDQTSVTQLLSGTAPRSGNGLVSILGKVNAIDGINLSAGAINVAGSIYSGARFVGAAPDFTDVVNANGLVSATNVMVKEGKVQIVADNDVTVSGMIAAPGGAGVRGGDISISAGGDVELNAGANVSARGNGANSAGGTVNVWGGNNASFHAGAVLDASAGSSGDGGAIELSARNLVTLAGGQFKAGAEGGRAGSILIDPSGVSFNWNGASYDMFTDGAAFSVIATDFITLNDVYLSTRKVAAGDANRANIDSAASTGESGSLLMQAPTITVSGGSKLLAHSDNGFAGGDVTLTATRTDGGDTQITVGDSTIKGRNVTLGASSSYSSALLAIIDQDARIDINSSRIEAVGGNVAMNASSTVDVSTSNLLPLGVTGVGSNAAVNVGGTSQIVTSGAGDARLAATSAVTAKALPGTPDFVKLPDDAGVAINVVDSHATVHVGGTSSVGVGGMLELAAKNTVSAEAKADASASGPVGVGGTLALAVINSVTTAAIDGDATVTQSGSIKVAAESSNTVVNSAMASGGGATQKGAATSKTEETLAKDKYKDAGATPDGSVGVAAAVAIADLTDTTQAYIASSQTVTSGGAVTVFSMALNKSTATADGSSTSGGVGVGAAVALNVGVATNLAFIADNSKVVAQGLTVSAVSPADKTSEYDAEAKSGAGAGNVGVAGALAANALVNTTVAAIEGDKGGSVLGADVNAGTGDVLIEARSAATSTVKSGADVKGTGDAAKVGIGASVGMNVAVNTTVAEIGDKARLTGGHDLTLKAKGDHATSTEVTGGAAGAQVAVTPVAAISIGVNTTVARAGDGTAVDLSGAYASRAEQTSTTSAVATGQTQGDKVAVGASIALAVATDTVAASIERDIDADQGVSVDARSVARSSASATASVAGGAKEGADGKPTTGDQGTPGKTVDQQVTAQGDAAKAAGKKTAAAAPATTPASGTSATSKLNETKAPPTTEEKKDDGTDNGGGVSVAAAVGVNVGVATTTASVARGKKISSRDGALTVSSAAQTDAKAKADGSQVNGGKTDVGVGAAVALNLGVGTNVAVIGDNADVDTKGVTVKAVMAVTPAKGETPEDKTSEFGADAKSGAGANNVGVAGALAVNAAVSTTVAVVEGDKDASGAGYGYGANVNATTAGGAGDILIEAQNATKSTVKSGADVKMEGDKANVGVGASVGLNVAVNTTVAEIADKATLTGGRDLILTAKADHSLSTTVEGGAAGAKVSVTPVAAVSIAVNTTTARLGESTTALGLSGKYESSAEQASAVSTEAKGQTEGDKVAVGASIALTVATDTVNAGVERDIDADKGVTVEAKTTAKSSASATASVNGGKKADSSGNASAGESVDEQVKKQGDAGKKAGSAADSGAASKLAANDPAKPKAESSEGAVSVAAAVGVNVGVATTTAAIGKGRKISSTTGGLKVASQAQTDASAKADGSQVDSGGTNVGIGAAVALNVGVATNQAFIGDNSAVTSNGLTISAVTPTGEKNDFAAEAKSGAGAGNVGVAGSLAANVVVNTSAAYLEGDKDASGAPGYGMGARANAGAGDVLIEARNASTSTVTTSADVKGSGDSAKVGVGASIGVNVAVNTTIAEAGDGSALLGGDDLTASANADHALSTTVTGGAAGAKVSVTPVVAATIGVNTTTARLGTSTMALAPAGTLKVDAQGKDVVTTKATGQAQGDVAVGASLAASIAVDNVTAGVDRNVASSAAIDIDAKSALTLDTESKAGAKGAKEQKKADGTPETGTTVDEQKKNQLDFAKGRNSAAGSVATTTPEAKTPDTNKDESGGTKESGKKVSVAAAIGVGVSYNEAKAGIGAGRSVGTSGKLGINAATDTDYSTMASGEAVSDDIGIAAAVGITATMNKTRANLGAGSTVTQAGDIEIGAISKQNRGSGHLIKMGAEATSGASGGEVAVAGALAVVANDNETHASIDEGATIGTAATPVGDIKVTAEDESRIAAAARAGALSKGGKSKAGVGASFAVLLANNKNAAAIGYDADGSGSSAASNIYADSATVTANKRKIEFNPLAVFKDIKNFSFDALDPANYLGINYYTEAVAGAASKGDAAVSGSFSVNVFGNTTEAYLGRNVNLTTSGSQSAGEQLGVEVAAQAETKAVAFAGAVAAAKKAGVGISNTDIVNLDQTLATIGKGSTVISQAAGKGVKVKADAKQDLANVSVSAAAAENVAVGGVLGVVVSLNKSQALIDDGATVKSKGDLSVTAGNDSTMVMISGGLGGAKEAGVGGAIAVNVVKNDTVAAIGKDAVVDASKNLTVAADADETAVTAVLAGAGGGKVGVAAALSLNTILTTTTASVGEDAKLNTDAAYAGADQAVAITARDDTVIVGVAGGGAGGGKAGIGAAIDTAVLAKSVKAFVADDTDADGQVATVKAAKNVTVDATSTGNVVSVAMGFAGGGSVGVGGAVSVGVVKDDVQAYIGKSAALDSDGNVLVNAQNDITAVLTSGAGAGGGNTGVGASLAVATLVGSTKAYVGEGATVNARGNRDAATVYAGETVVALQPDTPAMPGDLLAKKTESAKGLSVTAYNRENLVTTVVGGAGGGTAGVAATVSANVIANTAEAYVGRGAKINENNAAASADQQVRVKAVDETLLIDTAGAGAGGGSAGIGAAANVGVVAKTTKAWIGQSALVNAKKAVELDAASAALTFSTTAGFAGGGSAGVGGAVAGVGVANNTMAYIEDATSAANTAKVNVSAGDLALNATDFATSWLLTGAGAGGGAAGVGGALAVGVNASTTTARIGNYAETNASGNTEVHADSIENVNTITVAGAGGGSAGVSGIIGINVVVSKTEAGIGDHAKVNQTLAGQNVDVKATDRIITVGAGGAGAGGGAAGVGGTAVVTVALNTTSAYIGGGAEVDAVHDVKVGASSEKYVNSATVAGAGGGAAGVAGAVSVISVGSLLDGEAKSGLSTKDDNGNTTATRQSEADGQLNKSAVGGMLGSSDQSVETRGVLDSNASKLAVGQYMADTAVVPLKNTQAFIGFGADVNAGDNVSVTAKDTTLAIVASGAGSGGGAAGVAGSVGVVLLHDAAEAFIADNAKVDAGKAVTVAAETSENVFNVGITGCGGGAAGVCGSAVVNVVSSDTAAYIGAAEVNKRSASTEQSVAVTADSYSNLVTLGGSGSGAGAAAVGGILNVNTLFKDTKAYIAEGAKVAADKNIEVSAESAQNIVAGGVSIRGAGAAAVGAVAEVNVIANTTEAFIGSARDDASKQAAVVDSDGNVSVYAVDDSLIVAVSAVGNGAGAAGVGANVGANVVSSQTRAYVGELSTVNARGNAAGTDVYSGAIDNATPATMAPIPGGGSGDVDLDRNGTSDGSLNGGVSVNVKAQGENGGSSGAADNTVNPATAQGADGNAIGGVSGGLGTKARTSGAKGLSVVAMGNEKMITATVGVAGAGAAAVTGAATANVVSSVTEALIADQAKINTVAGGADPSVRVRAADNTFMVMVGGTVSGAGAAAVSGTADAAIIAKQTHARIGDADVKAANVEVAAASREDLFNISTNLAVAGAAGVGAAVGVNVITNETLASIGAGANIDATGDIRVNATQDSAMDLYTIAGAGGIVGVSGALSVGVIDNTTKAYVAGSTVPADAATLNAGGATEIKAESKEDILSVTVSGAGGGVGVAGAVGVRVVKSETAAYIGDNTQVNQTRNGAAQDVIVSAADTVKLSGGGGTVALAGVAGVGATAEVNIIRNTTTAYIGDSVTLDADRDVSVTATSVKNVQSAAVAAAGGGSVGIGGAVSVVSIGARLDDDSQGGLSESGSKGDTASFADSKIKEDKVSGQLGDSEHVQGTKTNVSGKVGGLGVAGDMNDASASSLDKTRAYIGGGSKVTAGRDVRVAATDKIKVDVNAVGAAGGFVGIGGAVGVAIVNSTTESFVGAAREDSSKSAAIVDAGGNVNVEADAENVDASGASVRAAAGAGGVVGLSAAVAVMNDTSTTHAYLGSGSEVQRAATLSVAADTKRKARADTFGATGGALAIGASVARATFDGSTAAYFDSGVRVGKENGKTVDDVVIAATDESTAITRATAGSAGIYSGAGADASATMGSGVQAYMGSGADVVAQDNVSVSATAKASADAGAIGVSAGAAAVGVSLASAEVTNNVLAYVGDNSKVSADLLTVSAHTALPASGISAKSDSIGAAGGLIGANGTDSKAMFDGSTTSYIGTGSTITGSASVRAETDTKQTATASGIAVGIIAAGANLAKAESNSDTRATLGANVKVTGASLAVLAGGTDDNFASATAGSGGIVAGSAAMANTKGTSHTLASVGAGDDSHQISVGNFTVDATHTNRFNGEVDSVNASVAGASGAYAMHNVNSTVLAEVGDDARVLANNIEINAENKVEKPWLGGGANGDNAAWNIRSGSGGVIDAPAGKSESHIDLDTIGRVGDRAQVHVLAPTSGDGTFNLDAYNEVIARDKAKLDSGGALAIAKASSMIYVDRSDATVSFGTDSRVISDLGDINAGARANAALESRAAADTYGLAGAPDGNAYAVFRGNNQAVVNDDALLQANDGAVNLAGGRSSSGTPTSIDARSTVNLWNKTAIPIATTPDAQSTVVSNAGVSVLGTGNVETAGDISLVADKGVINATATGIGKDIYRELAAAVLSGISKLFGGGNVSFDIHGGSTSVGGRAEVRVDGTAATGIHRNESLTLDVQNYNPADRSWTLAITRSRGVANPEIAFQVGIAEDINKRRNLLLKLAKDYAGTAAGDAYQAEVAFLEHKLVDLGLAYRDSNGNIVLGTGGGTGISPRAAALARVTTLTAQKDDIVNNQLPPVVSKLDAAATALDNYNNIFAARSSAISLWATEAAKSSPDTAYIAARKAEVAAAETTLTNRGVTGWVAQGAAATPNLTLANTERDNYNTGTVQPLQAQVPALTAQKTSLEVQRDDMVDNLSVLNRQITGYTDTVPDPDVVYPPLSNTAPSGPAADFVTVPNIKAQLGSIRVAGDALTGSGKLRAPGDAKVTITNNTPDYLIVKDITVDAEAARLSFNGVEVNSNADINRLNAPGHVAGFAEVVTGAANSSLPEVRIVSNYDPNNAAFPVIGPAPDIRLTGNITNTRGLVQVHSAAGSILSQGNIFAGTVDVLASNGDFVQSYVDNFNHVGGDPKTIEEHTATPGGILANGSVFISARYLNVNGIIQSGIDSYTLTLPTAGTTLTGSASLLGLTQAGNDQAALDAYRLAHPTGVTTFTNDRGALVTYNAAKNRLEVSESFAVADAASAQGKARNPSGLYTLVSDYGNIGANYDPANDRYVINGTEVKGGYIQLYGQIMNTASPAAGTGTGKLRVLDGYGQISITNPSGKDIVIAKLDTGRGVAGVIDITDIQYIDANNAPHSIKSAITRENGSVKIAQKGRWSLGGNGLPVAFDENWTTTSTTSSVVGATGPSGAASSRSATYNPQPGLAFTYTTGQDQSTYEDFSYEGTQFIGISAWRLAANLINYRIAGPYKSGTPVELEKGRYLASGRSLSNSYHTSSNTVVTNGPAVFKTTREYSYCDWWSLCITQTYHIDFSRITPTKDIVSNFLRADNPIGIEFIGADTGTVTVRSAQSAILTGAINNKAGQTTIVAGNSGTGVTAANKDIVQGSDSALITTKGLTLAASGSVGTPAGTGSFGAIRTAASGTVDAAAANGNVLITQTLGNLNVGNLTAAGLATSGLGRIVLQADGNIDAASPASLIQANRIDLTSDNGAIGSIAAPLKINVGYVEDAIERGYYGLTAAAQGDVGVEAKAWSGNPDGNLLVNTVVSAGGDVKLAAPGRIIDNNPIEQIDTRTWDELKNFWDSLGLRAGSAANADKQQQVVASFENGRTLEYRLYWQMRQRQADPSAYDPAFAYTVTAPERAALTASGMSAAQITQFEASRTAQYHQLHATAGAYTPAFSAGFHYTASNDEKAQILHGSSWTERELGISVSPGMLKDITNTNPVVKSANVQGRNVTLAAGVAIGETQTAVTVPYNVDPACSPGLPCLTDTMKVALAAAERSDIADTGSGIDVLRRKPVNFDAATALNAVVTAAPSAGTDNGNAFLASLGDARLNSIQVPGEARIKVRGSIINVSDVSPAVQTGNLVLEAANGGIGFVPDSGLGATVRPLRIDLNDDAALIARAAGRVNIIETTGDINVDTVFSRKDVSLTAQGSILDAHAPLIPPANIVRESELNILGDNITLVAQTGAIGTAANSLDVGVNPDGRIVASSGAGSVYLNGPIGHSFNIGSVNSGDAIGLSADLDMMIDGLVRGPGQIGLVSGGPMTMTPNADIHATTLGVFLRAGALTMEDDGTHAARMRVDSGAIDIETVGDALITGIETGNPSASAIRIVSTAGRVLDNGDTRLDLVADNGPDAKLTISGAKGIGDDPIDVQVRNLEASSGGIVDLAVQNSVNIVSITAGDRVLLSAGGDITGNSVTSTGAGNTNPDKSISITSANGNVNLANVSGKTDVAVSGRNGVNVDTLDVGSNLQLAGPHVSAVVNGGAGSVGGSVTGFGGGIASDVNLTLSGSGGFAFDNFFASTASVNLPLGSLSIDNALIVDRATFVNPLSTVLVDQHDRSIQRSSDVQLYSAGAPFSFSLAENHVSTDSFVIYRSPLHEVITPNGANSSVVEQGEDALSTINFKRPVSERKIADEARGSLISFTGMPVSLECDSDLDMECPK